MLKNKLNNKQITIGSWITIGNIIRYNKDPSWDAEIKEFENCIVNELPVINGSSKDALQTMKLVYKIYHADQRWREAYNISET